MTSHHPADLIEDLHRGAGEAANVRAELDAARRLLWIMADMHGGTVTIARASLERFDPAGTLVMTPTAHGGVTFEAKRVPGRPPKLPDLPPYCWDT